MLLRLLFALTLVIPACAGKDGAPGAPGLDGTQGPQGEPGAHAELTPYSPIELLNPCGDADGIADEVLIRLVNGDILVSFSDHRNGNNTRLALLEPGTYVTTDGDNCQFTITPSGELIDERH